MISKNVNLFGKRLPAWMLLAALIVVGAGATTGLVLKDSISGYTTIAVSQAILIEDVSSSGTEDEFLATIDDDGSAFAAHFEANNGDTLQLNIDVMNVGGSDDIVAIITWEIPDSISMEEVNDVAVPTGPGSWRFAVPSGGAAFSVQLQFEIAIEDAAPTGFYELTASITPVNV